LYWPGEVSCDSDFRKAFLALITPTLMLTELRAEMDLVKANMLVLSEWTGAVAGPLLIRRDLEILRLLVVSRLSVEEKEEREERGELETGDWDGVIQSEEEKELSLSTPSLSSSMAGSTNFKPVSIENSQLSVLEMRCIEILR